MSTSQIGIKFNAIPLNIWDVLQTMMSVLKIKTQKSWGTLDNLEFQ